MTERIDLDDVDVASDDDQGGGREGDWVWREDDAEDIEGDVRDSGAGASAPAATEDDDADDDPVRDSQGTRVPHVPSESSGSPAGIPQERGGSGGGNGGGSGGGTGGGAGGASADDGAPAGDEQAAGGSGTEKHASGPHGGGVDEMATAFTYDAVQRMADPRVAMAETNEFSDWVGLVGDVPAHAINKFLREHQLDIDFFNGSGDGPAQRLADIDEHSMFYSERMVVVGTASESWIAEEAGWEFVDVEEAAEKAGWSVAE